MKELVTVVVPLFNASLTQSEELSLSRCIELLDHFPLIFITGDGSNGNDLKEKYPQTDIYRFDPVFFETKSNFCKLLLSDDFYERFDWSEFLLVHNLNSLILRNELRYWCKQGYDYIQPFPDPLAPSLMDLFRDKQLDSESHTLLESCGISLRRVSAIRKVLKKKKSKVYLFKLGNPLNDALFWEQQMSKLFSSLILPKPVVRKRFARFSSENTPTDELFALTGLSNENL